MSSVNRITAIIKEGKYRITADTSGWKLEQLDSKNSWHTVVKFGDQSLQPLLEIDELKLRINELKQFTINLRKLVESINDLDLLLSSNICIDTNTNELLACLTKDQN